MRRCCGSPRPTCRCRTTGSSSGSRSPAPTAWSPPSAASGTSTEPPAPRPVSPMPTNVYMEALSPTMEEGRVVKWHKKEGDPVTTGDTLAEVETDKAVMDLVARADGVLRQVAAAEGQTVAVGSVVAVIAASGEAIGAAPASAAPATSSGGGRRETGGVATAAAPSAPAPATVAQQARVKASPLAKRIAKDAGVDLKLVTGSGPGGRVVKRDLERTPVPAPATALPVDDGSPPASSLPSPERPRRPHQDDTL